MLLRSAKLFVLCLLVAGCRPGATGMGDEQKDPYFLAGKNRLQERNYAGAIDMFEKALDVNPHSASAHFELGVLYEQQQADYAAALYHYDKAVKLRPDLLTADLARQRTQECKRELAKSVTQPLVMETMQRELDRLRTTNQALIEQVKMWQNYYGSRGGLPSNTVPPSNNPPPRVFNPGTPARQELAPPAAPSYAGRTHVIADRETPAAIARKYGIKLSALEAANPRMDARKLRPGQTLIIPAP